MPLLQDLLRRLGMEVLEVEVLRRLQVEVLLRVVVVVVSLVCLLVAALTSAILTSHFASLPITKRNLLTR